MSPNPPKLVRVLFDEFHSASWSISAQRAQEIQPEDPANASYQIAADALAQREFTVARNLSSLLDCETLAQTDLLALLHPCENRWEHTTTQNSPRLHPEEIASILDFVARGGGLLVITEYEHDKYGDNLNELLAPVGLGIVHGKVFDRSDCVQENPEWIHGQPVPDSPLAHLASRACFYRTGWSESFATQGSTVVSHTRTAWRSSALAHPPQAPLITLTQYGQGRIGLVCDSNLFGDDRIRQFDHLQLWFNLLSWLAVPSLTQKAPPSLPAGVDRSEFRMELLHSVNCLRAAQNPDGSLDVVHQPTPKILSIQRCLEILAPDFPHQRAYFSALSADLDRWLQSGCPKPDFSRSLEAFHPETDRRDNLEHLALFPIYTPNASSLIRFEALFIRSPWPAWLAELEQTRFRNPKFVPGHLLAFSDGYASECAVLFPETVSVGVRASNQFGIIFCDREATRLQRTALAAAQTVRLPLHPDLECLLHCKPLLLETLALWDLIHDASHSLGELPFDPFMIRQRAPFWMYALEELRVDLRTFEEANQLVRDGFGFARFVPLAILLDRIFRFPITGSRVRNYDALGGQLLFAFLHQRQVLIWQDNRLRIQWEILPEAIHDLRQELTQLYKLGSECSKITFWIASHDLISKYLRPNVASIWQISRRAIDDESDPKKWITLVHEDEFPLGSFHLNLQRKLQSSEYPAQR